MKKYLNYKGCFFNSAQIVLIVLLAFLTNNIIAQKADPTTATKKSKVVKNTFSSVIIMDNQTVLVPIKGTLEFDIQHRFGTVNNGTKDFFGLFAPSNIRLGINYSPKNKLFVGVGLTKEKMMFDVNLKYALLQQTVDNKVPVSVSYFGNVVMDTRSGDNFRNEVDRLSYFNQLMVARKITDKFSAQASLNLSWYNNVEAYVDKNGGIQKKMNNEHLSFSVLGRYKVSDKSAVIIGYDQPLTQHLTNNPQPNICFGFETNTSAHSFQVFAGNYYNIIPQSNNMFNQNNYRNGQFVIGFNITRLWNF